MPLPLGKLPELEKEVRIVKKHLPDINSSLAERLVKVVQNIREKKLDKTPGIAETLDWAKGLLALEYNDLNIEGIEKSLGCLLKSTNDIKTIKSEGVGNILKEIETE